MIDTDRLDVIQIAATTIPAVRVDMCDVQKALVLGVGYSTSGCIMSSSSRVSSTTGSVALWYQSNSDAVLVR
jgi:hypothetical protein